MAADIFLKLDGVLGESTTAGLPGWMEITSYDLSTTQPVEGSRSTSGSATSGRADHEDVGFAKQMDKATPHLLQKCCSGDIIASGEIAHYSAVNNEKVLFTSFYMESIVITEVSLSGSDGVPEETLKLSYGSIIWWYKHIDHKTGSKSGPYEGFWDVIENQHSKVGNKTAPDTL